MTIQKIKKDGPPRTDKITVSTLRDMYNQQERIACVTAYDYTMARMMDGAGADIILVGDSMGMVVQGDATTVGVNIEDVIYHVRCVVKGVRRAHIMADMPFMSYHASHDEGVLNAGNLLKAGAESVKVEGGEEVADFIWYLGQIGIPVMAHIGLKPQSVHAMGGYRIQGRSKAEADRIINDAQIMEEAGAFGLLIEGVPLEVAKEITDSVQIPTIGISSGPYCSGQILVGYDLLGANPDFNPRFVRKYRDMYGEVTGAVAKYVDDVKTGSFPSETESFHRNLVEVKSVKKEK